MAGPRTKHRRTESGWLSTAEIARAFDVPQNTFRATIGRMAPENAIRKGRGTAGHRWYARAVIEAWAAQRMATTATENGDPLLYAGGDSPALERYRHAMADLRVMDVEAKRGSLVDRERIRAELSQLAALLRSAGETLARQFGREAQAVLDDVLDRFENYLGKPEEDGRRKRRRKQ